MRLSLQHKATLWFQATPPIAKLLLSVPLTATLISSPSGPSFSAASSATASIDAAPLVLPSPRVDAPDPFTRQLHDEFLLVDPKASTACDTRAEVAVQLQLHPAEPSAPGVSDIVCHFDTSLLERQLPAVDVTTSQASLADHLAAAAGRALPHLDASSRPEVLEGSRDIENARTSASPAHGPPGYTDEYQQVDTSGGTLSDCVPVEQGDAQLAQTDEMLAPTDTVADDSRTAGDRSHAVVDGSFRASASQRCVRVCIDRAVHLSPQLAEPHSVGERLWLRGPGRQETAAVSVSNDGTSGTTAVWGEPLTLVLPALPETSAMGHGDAVHGQALCPLELWHAAEVCSIMPHDAL